MGEHRIHKRKPCDMSFECQNYFTEKGVPQHFQVADHFTVHNISQGGMLISGEKTLKKDMILWYTLYLECIPYVVLSRVRWVDEGAVPLRYGVEFLSPSNMLYRHIRNFVDEKDFFKTVDEFR